MKFLVLNNHGFGGQMDGGGVIVDAPSALEAAMRLTGHTGPLLVEHPFPGIPYLVVQSQPPPNKNGRIYIELIAENVQNISYFVN